MDHEADVRRRMDTFWPGTMDQQPGLSHPAAVAYMATMELAAQVAGLRDALEAQTGLLERIATALEKAN